MKAGWEIKTWQDVLEVRSGRNQKEVLNPEGKYPIIGSAGKIMNYADNFLCEEGTTIIGRKGTIDKPKFITTKFWNVDTAFGLVSGEQLDKRFLFYFCLSFDFQTLNKGTTLPSLVKKDLVGIQIPIPPLKEQKQIVAILDKAFAAINQAQANIQQNIQNAQDLFQSKLNQIFSQQGEGWEEKVLSEFVKISHGHSFKSKDFEVDFHGKNPIVLTPGNFSESSTLYFTEKNTKRCTGEYPESLLFEKGELVVVMTDLSSKMKILGKPSIIDQEGILHNQRIGRLLFKNDVVDKSYLFFYFQTSNYLKEIKSTATGTMVRHTAPKRILATKIRFPSALEYQHEYVRLIYSIKDKRDQLILKYEKKLVDLEELKKTLLQKAFTGELTHNEQAA